MYQYLEKVNFEKHTLNLNLMNCYRQFWSWRHTWFDFKLNSKFGLVVGQLSYFLLVLGTVQWWTDDRWSSAEQSKAGCHSRSALGLQGLRVFHALVEHHIIPIPPPTLAPGTAFWDGEGCLRHRESNCRAVHYRLKRLKFFNKLYFFKGLFNLPL